MEPNLERPYYQDTGRRPYLYYAAIGGEAEELRVSRSRHHVEEMPLGLNLTSLQRPEHSEYIDRLLGGTLGKILEERDHTLYEAAKAAQSWLVLQGEVQNDGALDYLRSAVGFVQAAVETGAVAVLDLQTLELYSGKGWTEQVFVPRFRPCEHAVILSSPCENGTLWFHTRGMRKFGRPDIGLTGVPQGETQRAVALLNQMIYAEALGAVFTRSVGLHLSECETCVVHPELAGDREDPDYNNEHYSLRWEDCQFENQ